MGLFRNLATIENKIIFCALHDPQLISRFADYRSQLKPRAPGRLEPP